jgi:HAMP domain-containing protein
VTDLRAARSLEEARQLLARFHDSYEMQGYAGHAVGILGHDGRPAVRTGIEAMPGAAESPAVVVPFINAFLAEDPLALIVNQDDSALRNDLHRRWRAWALHVAATAGVTSFLLFVVIRREVTGPIERLLRGIRKMELGYWDDMPDPGGARELRWLGWRFRALAQELSRTVEHLVAAQRLAADASPDVPGAPELDEWEMHATNTASPGQDEAQEVTKLHAELERLRAADPREPDSIERATSMWARSAARAEQLGQVQLRLQIEDAALRIMEPDEFISLARRIDMERPRMEAMAIEKAAQLQAALAARHVPVVEISHRIKHTAGIWKKMRQKGLSLEQVHDRVALRILTPTQADCYVALGVVHRLYAPIVSRFKDYIARPKPNGYRSLHLSVRDASGLVFEVQIRSLAMHRHAERGRASHLDYKEATRVTVVERPAWRRLGSTALRKLRVLP